MSSLREANKALLARKYKLAVSLYRAAVREQPQNPLSHQGLAEAVLRNRSYDEAILEAGKALELDPKLASPHVIMAYANYGKKKMDVFRAEAQEAYRLDPNSPDVLTCHGIMLLVDRKLHEAIDALAEAVRAEPMNIVARTNLVYALTAAGRAREALTQSRQVFSIAPSLRAGFRLLAAFGRVYAHLSGIIVVLCTILALVWHSYYLLVPAALSALYILGLGVLLLFRRQWRAGLVGVGYGLVGALIAVGAYVLVR